MVMVSVNRNKKLCEFQNISLFISWCLRELFITITISGCARQSPTLFWSVMTAHQWIIPRLSASFWRSASAFIITILWSRWHCGLGELAETIYDMQYPRKINIINFEVLWHGGAKLNHMDRGGHWACLCFVYWAQWILPHCHVLR